MMLFKVFLVQIHRHHVSELGQPAPLGASNTTRNATQALVGTSAQDARLI